MSRVVVLGSANIDLTVRAGRLPRPGETVTDGEFMISFGGKGANQATAALRAGAEVVFLAKIGRDPYGNLLYDHLISAGFDGRGLLRDQEAPAGLALIAVDHKGNNQIVVAPGSNRRFGVEDLKSVEWLMGDASIFLVQLEIPLPTVHYALRAAKSRGMTTILNPAPAAELTEEIYSLVDIITPNETEAGDLTGIRVGDPGDAERAAIALQSMGIHTVVVTLGEAGALLARGERILHFPAFSVQAVDSVGAGDAFNGVLAAELAEASPVTAAIQVAGAAGALATTRRGAQESLPTREEIEKLLRSRE